MKKKEDELYIKMVEFVQRYFKKPGGTMHQHSVKGTGGAKRNLPIEIINFSVIIRRIKKQYGMIDLFKFKTEEGWKQNPNFKPELLKRLNEVGVYQLSNKEAFERFNTATTLLEWDGVDYEPISHFMSSKRKPFNWIHVISMVVSLIEDGEGEIRECRSGRKLISLPFGYLCERKLYYRLSLRFDMSSFVLHTFHEKLTEAGVFMWPADLALEQFNTAQLIVSTTDPDFL